MTGIADRVLRSGALTRLSFVEEPRGARDRSADVRRKIVNVAERRFLELGYAAVSTHDISREASTHQSLIRYHFGTKLGLWQAAMDRYFGGFRNEVHAAMVKCAGLDDRAFLEHSISYLVLWHGRHAPFVQRTMTQINLIAGESLQWLVERHIKAVYDFYLSILQEGQKAGLVREIPLPNLYYILFLCSSIFSLRKEIQLVTGLDTESSRFDTSHAAAVIALLMTPAGPDAADTTGDRHR